MCRVSWQISVLPQTVQAAREPIVLTFHIHLKYEMNMRIIYFNREKMSIHTIFKFKSTKINLLSSLNFFVRQNGGFGERKGKWWCIWNLCLHLTHSSAHTAVRSDTHTHTQCEHTRSSGQPMLRRPRAVGGSVLCSRAPQSWYWGWRERWIFTPPTYNPCRTWDSNPRPLGYKSDSLSIRPRLP